MQDYGIALIALEGHIGNIMSRKLMSRKLISMKLMSRKLISMKLISRKRRRIANIIG